MFQFVFLMLFTAFKISSDSYYIVSCTWYSLLSAEASQFSPSHHVDSRCLRILFVLLVTFYSAKSHMVFCPKCNTAEGAGASEDSRAIHSREVRWWLCERMVDQQLRAFSASLFIPRLGRSPEGEHGPRSSILAWRLPWTEEPGGLQSMGSQRVRHD